MAIGDLTWDCFLEASLLDAQADESAVTSWTDGTTTVAQATAGLQPTLKKDALNGESVIEFDGAQALVGALTSGNDGVSWTRTIVARIENFGSAEQYITGSSRSYPEGAWVGRGGYGQAGLLRFGHSATTYGWTSAAVDEDWHVITVCWDHVNEVASMWLDGTLQFANSYTGSVRTQDLFLVGARQSTGADPEAYMTGAVAAIFQTPTVLDATERAVVHGYCQDTYGIQVADYDGPVDDPSVVIQAPPMGTTLSLPKPSVVAGSTVTGGGPLEVGISMPAPTVTGVDNPVTEVAVPEAFLFGVTMPAPAVTAGTYVQPDDVDVVAGAPRTRWVVGRPFV